MLAKHPDGDQLRIEIADWSALPDGEALRSEMRELLENAIRELPEAYYSVILMRDMEELSTQEAAQILDITDDVAKTRLHRARLAIRQRLDRYLRGNRRKGVEEGEKAHGTEQA